MTTDIGELPPSTEMVRTGTYFTLDYELCMTDPFVLVKVSIKVGKEDEGLLRWKYGPVVRVFSKIGASENKFTLSYSYLIFFTFIYLLTIKKIH